MAALAIDFNDESDIRAKLPAAKLLLDGMEAKLIEQQQEVEEWRAYIAALARRADRLAARDDNESPDRPRTPAATPEGMPSDAASPDAEADESSLATPKVQPVDLVVEVVDRELRKIKAKAVAEILRSEGHAISNNTVSNSLFYAAKRLSPPRIKTADGRGFYAPLAYIESPTTDYADGEAVRGGNPDQLHAAVDADERVPVEGGGA